MMERDRFTYTHQTLWLLSGLSTVLLMVLLLANCLLCRRQHSTSQADEHSQDDVCIQLEQIHAANLQGRPDVTVHSDDHDRVTQLNRSVDQSDHDLKEVLDKLSCVNHKWYDIGILLGMSGDDLDTIKDKNHNQLDACLKEMLTTWLRQGKVATTQALSAALRIGYPDIAKSLESSENVLDSRLSVIDEEIKPEGINPSKPGKPQCSSVSHDSIQLEWSRPEQGAHNVTAYTVFYRSTSDPPDTWIEIRDVKKEEMLLTQLSENASYCFKIRPEYETGSGPHSDISDPVGTKMIIPSMSDKENVSSLSHSSIQLERTRPKHVCNVTSWNDPLDQPRILASKSADEEVVSMKTKRVTFLEAVNKLWEAREKWYYIGLCLGINKTDLDIIEKDNRQTTDSCFRKMISLWLNLKSGTWQMLIDALRDKTVCFHDLADQLLAENLSNTSTHIDTYGSVTQESTRGFKCPLCGNCSLEKYLKGECPRFHSISDSAFPFLDTHNLTSDERLNLHAKLIKETDNIVDEFHNLIDQVTDSFYEMSRKELLKAANLLSISDPLPDDNPAGSIIQCLKKKSSFFNHHFIQRIIAKFGSDKDKKVLSTYEVSFKSYCERSIFEVPEAVFGPPPDRGQMLAFKVTDQIIWSLPHSSNHGLPIYHHTVSKSAQTLRLSLNDALKVQIKIAEILGIENVGNLVFLGASKGCIELKFSAPIAILDKIKERGVRTLTQLPGFADLEAANIHLLCGPPGKPNAIHVAADCIHLEWSKPEYQGSHPVQHYCIHYKSLKDRSAKWRTVQEKASIEYMEIRRLHQNEMPFIFKVQAVDSIGAGVPSQNSDPVQLLVQLVSSRTEISGDIPSKPGKPEPLNITHDSIQLSWTKPEKGAESIISYAILYRCQFNDPPNQWMEIRTEGFEEIIIVSQLIENTNYIFQVLPEYKEGFGSASEVSYPIRTKIITPGKPGKPRPIKVTHDSIELEWTKPEQGAHNVTSYSVFYSSTSDPAKEYKVITSEERVLITQLQENATYCFKIQPQSMAGDGLQSDVSDLISTPTFTTASIVSFTLQVVQGRIQRRVQGSHGPPPPPPPASILNHSLSSRDTWQRASCATTLRQENLV